MQRNSYRLCRYSLLAWVIILNAIICSIGIWHLDTEQPTQSGTTGTRYAIFLGAFAIALLFLLIFIELLMKGPITTRLWFECSWVIVLWAMEFSGAVSLTLNLRNSVCSAIISKDFCLSLRVLTAFSWLCALGLLGYMILLGSSLLKCHRFSTRIWQRPISEFDWTDPKKPMFGTPSSPSALPFNQDKFVVAAPLARREQDPDRYAYRSGLGSEYEIEHYRPPSLFLKDRPLPGSGPIPPVPPLPPMTSLAGAMTQQISREERSAAKPVTTIYPEHIQAALAATTPLPKALPKTPMLSISALSITGGNGKQPSTPSLTVPADQHRVTSHAPRPLPPSPHRGLQHEEASREKSADLPQVAQIDNSDPRSSSQMGHRSRPSGPRRRSTSSDRGGRRPMLDLLNISSYKDPHA